MYDVIRTYRLFHRKHDTPDVQGTARLEVYVARTYYVGLGVDLRPRNPTVIGFLLPFISIHLAW